MTKSKVNNKNQKASLRATTHYLQLRSQLGNMRSKVNSAASSFTAKADEYKKKGEDRWNRYRIIH